MLQRAPELHVRDLLVNNWDNTNTDLNHDPPIHTGAYDDNRGGPQVNITAPEESTVRGGHTGISAGTGAGGQVRERAGTVLVKGWAGTRSETEDADSTTNNPKQLAYSLTGEADRVLAEAGDSIPLPDELNSVSADTARRLEPNQSPALWRWELTVRFTYIDSTG